ncbi:MAG: MarR family transcriptional regulator [Bacteroidaceae bacterium]|nr:MarR family transcriptional regulator [Bacteroidaceae bacterium]
MEIKEYIILIQNRFPWLWNDPVKLRCWLDLLSLSAKGEVRVSYTQLSKRWKMPKSTVQHLLKDLNKKGPLFFVTSDKNGTTLKTFF